MILLEYVFIALIINLWSDYWDIITFKKKLVARLAITNKLLPPQITQQTLALAAFVRVRTKKAQAHKWAMERCE
jgi:hypothetical protein